MGTSDAWFDDMREFKFSECRLQKVATVAVVTRIKVMWMNFNFLSIPAVTHGTVTCCAKGISNGKPKL